MDGVAREGVLVVCVVGCDEVRHRFVGLEKYVECGIRFLYNDLREGNEGVWIESLLND